MLSEALLSPANHWWLVEPVADHQPQICSAAESARYQLNRRQETGFDAYITEPEKSDTLQSIPPQQGIETLIKLGLAMPSIF